MSEIQLNETTCIITDNYVYPGTHLSERLKKFRWFDWLFNRDDIMLEVELLERALETRKLEFKQKEEGVSP